MHIVECGEELVDYREVVGRCVLGRPPFQYRRETIARASVARMLAQAASAMPKGYLLGITEGWRAPHIQRRMYLGVWNMFQARHPDWSDVMLRRVVNRFTAPLDRRVPPPHSTGGAVDIFLTDLEGRRLDVSKPYEPSDHHGFPMNAPRLSEESRRLRQILCEALLPTDLTNYPSEWWHWTYGDQGWAYRGGHPHALYGATEPPGWSPAPEDDTLEAFAFLRELMDQTSIHG